MMKVMDKIIFNGLVKGILKQIMSYEEVSEIYSLT